MLLFPDHSTLLICISKTQMENVVHNKSKTQDWGLTWGSSAMLNWELWTPNTVSCPSQVFPSFQDSWRALWGLHEVLQEKCHHTESSDGRTFNGRLFAPNILCTSWKTTAQFPRGRAYTNRAKLLDGLSQQFFFKHSSFLFSPRGESGKFSQAEDALATEHLSKHIIHKTWGFFPLSF